MHASKQRDTEARRILVPFVWLVVRVGVWIAVGVAGMKGAEAPLTCLGPDCGGAPSSQ